MIKAAIVGIVLVLVLGPVAAMMLVRWFSRPGSFRARRREARRIRRTTI